MGILDEGFKSITNAITGRQDIKDAAAASNKLQQKSIQENIDFDQFANDQLMPIFNQGNIAASQYRNQPVRLQGYIDAIGRQNANVNQGGFTGFADEFARTIGTAPQQVSYGDVFDSQQFQDLNNYTSAQVAGMNPNRGSNSIAAQYGNTMNQARTVMNDMNQQNQREFDNRYKIGSGIYDARTGALGNENQAMQGNFNNILQQLLQRVNVEGAKSDMLGNIINRGDNALTQRLGIGQNVLANKAAARGTQAATNQAVAAGGGFNAYKPIIDSAAKIIGAVKNPGGAT
ncbi:hypothetical protein [uncultured Mediterranean phage uvMED]|nr:hypothetical protein [uncultured Mediterranean phage uvMED]